MMNENDYAGELLAFRDWVLARDGDFRAGVVQALRRLREDVEARRAKLEQTGMAQLVGPGPKPGKRVTPRPCSGRPRGRARAVVAEDGRLWRSLGAATRELTGIGTGEGAYVTAAKMLRTAGAVTVGGVTLRYTAAARGLPAVAG